MNHFLLGLWLLWSVPVGAHFPQASYTRGLGLPGGIGGLLARTDAAGSAYYHADGAGNVTALMDAQQNIVARYLYDPFGNLLAQSGPLASANWYRFSSKEVHPLSGLYDYGFRYYDPNLQRWLNADPLGETLSGNLYGAFANSPLNVYDPDGLDNLYFQPYPGFSQSVQNAPVNFAISKVYGVNRVYRPSPAYVAAPGSRVPTAAAYYETVLTGDISYQSRALGTDPAAELILRSPHLLAALQTFSLSDAIADSAQSPDQKARLQFLNAALQAGLLVSPLKGARCATAAKETTSLLPARSPWPGNSGFIEGTVERKFLLPGETFDRYGFGGGRFVSPAGAPIEARALRPGTENLPFNTYQVVKPFEANAGGVQPWFGQPGLGTQYELPVSVNTLLNRGIIKPAP